MGKVDRELPFDPDYKPAPGCVLILTASWLAVSAAILVTYLVLWTVR